MRVYNPSPENYQQLLQDFRRPAGESQHHQRLQEAIAQSGLVFVEMPDTREASVSEAKAVQQQLERRPDVYLLRNHNNVHWDLVSSRGRSLRSSGEQNSCAAYTFAIGLAIYLERLPPNSADLEAIKDKFRPYQDLLKPEVSTSDGLLDGIARLARQDPNQINDLSPTLVRKMLFVANAVEKDINPQAASTMWRNPDTITDPYLADVPKLGTMIAGDALYPAFAVCAMPICQRAVINEMTRPTKTIEIIIGAALNGILDSVRDPNKSYIPDKTLSKYLAVGENLSDGNNRHIAAFRLISDVATHDASMQEKEGFLRLMGHIATNNRDAIEETLNGRDAPPFADLAIGRFYNCGFDPAQGRKVIRNANLNANQTDALRIVVAEELKSLPVLRSSGQSAGQSTVQAAEQSAGQSATQFNPPSPQQQQFDKVGKDLAEKYQDLVDLKTIQQKLGTLNQSALNDSSSLRQLDLELQKQALENLTKDSKGLQIDSTDQNKQDFIERCFKLGGIIKDHNTEQQIALNQLINNLYTPKTDPKSPSAAQLQQNRQASLGHST